MAHVTHTANGDNVANDWPLSDHLVKYGVHEFVLNDTHSHYSCVADHVKIPLQGAVPYEDFRLNITATRIRRLTWFDIFFVPSST